MNRFFFFNQNVFQNWNAGGVTYIESGFICSVLVENFKPYILCHFKEDSPCSSMYSTMVLTNSGTSWPGWPLCCTSSRGIPNTLAVLRDSLRVRERLFLIASTAASVALHDQKTQNALMEMLQNQSSLRPQTGSRSYLAQTLGRGAGWQSYVNWSDKLQTWYTAHTDGSRWLSCKVIHHIISLSIRTYYITITTTTNTCSDSLNSKQNITHRVFTLEIQMITVSPALLTSSKLIDHLWLLQVMAKDEPVVPHWQTANPVQDVSS